MPQCPLILICDDDPVVHESLGMYLDAEGYEHISAYNGEEALARRSALPSFITAERTTLEEIVLLLAKGDTAR